MKGLSRSSWVKAGESPAFFASLIRLFRPFPGRWNLRGRLAGTTIAVPNFGRLTPRARPVSSPTVREGVCDAAWDALPDGRATALKRSCLFCGKRVIMKGSSGGPRPHKSVKNFCHKSFAPGVYVFESGDMSARAGEAFGECVPESGST